MRIIKDIEIKYFRSIYSIKLKNILDLTILSGKNDSGKSNILRALNLFFNSEIDLSNNLEFYQDFSFKRLNEVRKESIKGKQFIQIKITFERPPSYEKSLPLHFDVSRTWYRNDIYYNQTDNLESLHKSGKLPNKLETAKRMLQGFLNKIRFEYVPAVKDRDYFNSLLFNLQQTLLDEKLREGTPITETITSLTGHIEKQIEELQQDFRRATGIDSTITPPSDFASLFQAFQVGTGDNEDHIPLLLRGDGIQARFISSVLHYITKTNSNYFIWGFEEPENSLELNNALLLSKDFQELYAKTAQLILTSHSPAFFSLTNKNTSIFRVSKNSGSTIAASIWPNPKDQNEFINLREEIGILEIEKQLSKERLHRLEEKQKIP